MAAMANPLQLQQVLSLTTSLHDNSSSGNEKSLLSLRQLVPVHKSLLQATATGAATATAVSSSNTPHSGLSSSSAASPPCTSKNDQTAEVEHECGETTAATSPSSSSSSFEQLLRQLSLLHVNGDANINREELILCGEILHDDTSDTDVSRRKKLLVLQYLLFVQEHQSRMDGRKEDEHALVLLQKRLSSILLPVVPWMFSSAADEPDFLEAILDAVFDLPASTHHDDIIMDDLRCLLQRLQPCFEQLRKTSMSIGMQNNDRDKNNNNNDNIRSQWILTCRLLTRIHDYVSDYCSTSAATTIATPQHQLVLDAVVQQILAGLDLLAPLPVATADSPNNSFFPKEALPPEWILPSIHNDLLPLLLVSTTTTTTTNLVPIWEHVWRIYQNDKAGPASQRWMLVTAILCAILPRLLDQNLPLSALALPHSTTNKNDDNTTSPNNGGGGKNVDSSDHHYHVGYGRPINCYLLWKLIHQCLSQGLYITKKQSWIEESWADSSKAPPPTGDAPSHSNTGTGTGTSPLSRVDLGTSQLLRRRGLYLLNALVESSTSGGGIGSSSDTTTVDSSSSLLLLLWKKYVACFETIEMEHAPHLIDQVWETVAEIGSQLKVDADNEEEDELAYSSDSSAGGGAIGAYAYSSPPALSWKWMYPMLARVITSSDAPSLRKLSLYRLFQGQAGILVGEPCAVVEFASQKKKNRTGNRPVRAASGRRGAPLSVVTPAFVLEIVLPAFDTLESSVGCMMHLEEDRKEVRHDMYNLLANFLDAYLTSLDNSKCQSLFRGLWSNDVLCQLNRKTTVSVCAAIADSLRNKPDFVIPTVPDMYSAAVESLRDLFSLGSLIPSQAESLVESMAVMLSRCKPVEPLSPPLILSVLTLFPISLQQQEPLDDDEGDDANNIPERKEKSSPIVLVSWIERDPILGYLRQWVSNICSAQPRWTSAVGTTIATAYVDGSLFSSLTASTASAGGKQCDWDPCAGASAMERDWGKAVTVLCTILSSLGSQQSSANTSTTPGELLWPAISKGLVSVPMLLISKSWVKADAVTRALILLENGCKLRVISGMGNGDLVVDRKTQQMMPPPPNVEKLIGFGVSFLLHHIQHLFSTSTADTPPSSQPKVLSATFTSLISQLATLHEAYPSSLTIHEAVNKILNDTLQGLSDQTTGTTSHSVLFMTTVYATLSCGAEISHQNLLELCANVMKVQYVPSMQSKDGQGARSVFEYAKWATLSILLCRVFETTKRGNDVDTFVDRLVDEAVESVQSAPPEGLMPIFDCVLTSAKFGLEQPCDTTVQRATNVEHLDKLVRSFVRIMKDCKGSGKVAYMLDESTSLLFRPELLLDEADRLMSDPSSKSPLRTAFRDFVQLAGTRRHHILEAVLCRITAGWMGPSTRLDAAGIAAIPYLDDITNLLLYKEERIDETSFGQTEWRKHRVGRYTILPTVTHESSVARGFLLQFLSQLPDVGAGLSPLVLSDLLNPLIYSLLEEVKPLSQGTVSLGSIDFIRKIRGWQALCILSRFVTAETADHVCTRVFKAMGEMLHGQIRYFIEVFTIQACRKHPPVFGRALVKEITRTDLSLQQVSSLMIVAGNLIVGRYRSDFFQKFDMLQANEDGGASQLDLLLSGLIPWLGSTQGFSRAIAQLLVHQLVPMVVDVKVPSAGNDSNWYLHCIYNFLDKNSEMRRLRSKQTSFFDQYDVDSVCTPEGILSIKVDDGGEAFPVHAVEVMKECLRQVYQEANAANTPTWKQLESISLTQQQVCSTMDETPPSSVVPRSYSVDDPADVGAVVNFQRKIVPIDALNLALEDMRQVRLRNRAGRKKQKLVVCATFIDKVPNLGGLARTAEIFAAERLVIPDLRVTKTDNFKSLSVSAGDWIEIEECKEENLLSWLLDRKREGYFVVGLEQTPSSISLHEFAFPNRPIVLLLGKEKEGIPVEFLQLVDQCVEIPQLGIIRSLNVHVSAAVAIWEKTRQSLGSGNLIL